MLHKMIIVGYVGREPETRTTPTGKQVTSFSVASNFKRGGKTYTTWFRVNAWGKLGDISKQYLGKGSLVYIEGRLYSNDSGEPRTYTDKNGKHRASYEVTAEMIRFLSRKQGDPDITDEEVIEDEIPF